MIKDGRNAAEDLNEDVLKGNILSHFAVIEKMLDKDLHIEELEYLSKRLMIGVKEAMCFKDLDILAEVEIYVRESINRFRE